MKRTIRMLCVLIGVLAVSTAALAVDYDFTDALGDHQWNNPQNWVGGPNVPGPNDKATIDDKTCEIAGVDQQVLTLVLLNGADLYIDEERQLTLHGDATITGSSVLHFGPIPGGGMCAPQAAAPVLMIADDLTIKGDGEIRTTCAHGIIKPPPNAGRLVLTLKHEPGGTLKVHATGSNQELDIQASTVNHARVGAGSLGMDSAGTLKLSSEKKSGSGEWFAINGGTLVVEATVSGSAEWKIIRQADPGPGGPEVQINTACTGLSGLVRNLSGLLDVNENFCTQGDLIYGVTKARSLIEVAPGKYASFAARCP